MLTLQQRQKLKNAGYNDAQIASYEAKKVDAEPVRSSFFDRLKQGYAEGGQDVKRAVSSGAQDISEGTAKGGISGALQALKGVGESALGTVGAVAKTALTPVSAVLEPVVAPVVSKIASIPGVSDKVELVSAWAQKHPEAAQNLEDVFNIAGLGVGGQVAKLGSRAGEAVGGAVKSGAKSVAKTVKGATGEVIPSSSRIANTQVTKALDLTQGDVKNINLSTGHEVGEFIADRNLIRGTKAETEKAIKEFHEATYKQVREEIGKVTKEYSPVEVPRLRQALTEIEKQVKEVPGLEETAGEVKSILSKQTVTLNDVQRVKELMDDQFSLYKITGDVKESAAKVGLANVRKDIKEFIEKEVKDTTGTDIASLNNEVATSRGIMDAIEQRSTRGLTRSNIRLGDLATFGLATSATNSPLFGAAAVFAKKVIESPAVRLKIAKYFDGISDAKKARIQKILSQGKVPSELQLIAEPKKDIKQVPKVASKLSADVKQNIVDIIDDYRLNKGKNLSLQEDAAKIAEDFGIEMPKTYGALVNKLESLLEQPKKVLKT